MDSVADAPSVSNVFVEKFKAARRVSTPLIGVTTLDQTAAMVTLEAAVPEGHPVVSWDLLSGMVARNEAGDKALTLAFGDKAAAMTTNPWEALKNAQRLPPRTLVFALNAHRVLPNEGVSQGLMNLRNPFKSDRRTLVLLGPAFDFPVELQPEVLLLDMPLPDDRELAGIVTSTYTYAKLPAPKTALVTRAVDAVRGLAPYPVEQVVAMSLTPDGLNLQGLWDRKRQWIAQTNGLSIYRGTETFDDLGGLGQIKRFMTLLFKGRQPWRVVVIIDEIEKSLGGATGPVADNTGVSQDMLGVLLKEMENRRYGGLIAVGIPGTGKTAVAKAAGNAFGALAVELDIGALKDKYLGNTEMNVRAAMKVLNAVAGDGGAFFVATANRLEVVPPELRRRFKHGIWFYDTPDAEEKAGIWRLYLERYQLPVQDLPDDVGWTGSDIKNVCELAWQLDLPLAQAQEFIVPVCVSDPDAVERLRGAAHNRFLSASRGGVYRNPEAGERRGNRRARPGGRLINTMDVND
jgi:hypothetical protein